MRIIGYEKSKNIAEAHGLTCVEIDSAKTFWYDVEEEKRCHLSVSNRRTHYMLGFEDGRQMTKEFAEKFIRELYKNGTADLSEYGLIISDFNWSERVEVTNEFDDELDRERPLKVVIVDDPDEEEDFEDNYEDDFEDEEALLSAAEVDHIELAKQVLDEAIENDIINYVAKHIVDEDGKVRRDVDPKFAAEKLKACCDELLQISKDISGDTSTSFISLVAYLASDYPHRPFNAIQAAARMLFA